MRDFEKRPLMAATTLRIGIASVEKQRQWALEIALVKRSRHEDDPVGWFPSMSALSRVLSDENMVLIDAIREFHPDAAIQSDSSSNLRNLIVPVAQPSP